MCDMQSDFLFYKKYTDVFLDATKKLQDIFEKFKPEVKIIENEEFSNLLLKIYLCFMTDTFPSCNILMQAQNFFSVSILCRSILDITVQLMWILDIKEPEKKQEAINLFLNFDGAGEYTNKKGETVKTYQWQDIITQDRFNYDKIIKRLRMDCENKENKSTFDYLSKVLHWNPKVINKLVGTQQGHLVFGPEKLRMFFISSTELIRCSASFIIIFLEHFHAQECEPYLAEIVDIQKSFFNSLKSIKHDE